VSDYGIVLSDPLSDPKVMTSVFSLADIADKYMVTFDSSQVSHFVVYNEKRPIKFK